MMFFGGALQAVAVMLLWLAELIAQARGTTLPLAIPAVWAHAFLMLYGLFPFFIFGFLLTVYPRWMNAPPVPRARYVPAFALLAAGNALFYPALFLGKNALLVALTLILAGFVATAAALYVVFLNSHKPEHRHERTLNLALTLGALGLLAFGTALHGPPRAFVIAREIGLWLFLIPVIFTVSHRMIPFFSSNVLEHYKMVRPAWSLPAMLALAAAHAAFEITGLVQWRFLADLPLTGMVLYHTIAWGFFRSFRVRLLAMLHIAFLWLSIAGTLYALQSLALLITGTLWLPRAPLHALGIGFIGGLVVAMVSRVTLGHSGRPLRADALTWRTLLGLNAVALIRIAAELPFGLQWRAWTNVAAAAAWLAVLGPWVVRCAPVYLKPRSDGRPG